uniref:TuMV resistance-like protein n=1 Tax=Brassica rapa subsp. chinensis TaxID=93385 RepID=D6RS99_BRARC|nr:TuMV resistance-like protein [Brassica rapa subsp. chinensis]
MAFASSSSSIVLSKCEFDVFSFHGADVRKNFLSHVLIELKSKGIDVFIDNDIRRSKSIGPFLIDAIKGSRVAIVLLSEDYASSTWCLNELVEIMKCRREFGQTVMPIFYQVDPSDVKKQTGEFGKVFQKICKGKTEEKIRRWKEALTEVANIAGFHSSNWKSEAEMIEKIATKISNKLNLSVPCSYCDGLVGIESHMTEMRSLLSLDCDEVRKVGILGMAGIGKTTIARSLYNRHCQNFQRFDGCCFLSNEIDELKLQGIDQLQQKLLIKLLDDETLEVGASLGAHKVLKDRLLNKKLFIVLDNVDNKQISLLIGEAGKQLYRDGSRIIITTRDKKLLDKVVDGTYVVPRLNGREALELFCSKAFGNHYPTEEFVDLSNDFVCYAKGLPLALKLLGKGLLTHDINYWKKKLEFLQVNPDKELQKELKSSYKALDDDQKSVFLDIACFFRSEKADFVSSILKSDDIDAKDVMRELEEKCLVMISYDRIEMHDLLHAMGKEIGKEKSIRKAGERRRLSNCELLLDILSLLFANSGSECLKGDFKALNEIKAIKGFPAAFSMLGDDPCGDGDFLKFHGSHCSTQGDNRVVTDHEFQASKIVGPFPIAVTNLLDLMRLDLHNKLPGKFDPKELKDLSLRWNHIKDVIPPEIGELERLRHLDLGFNSFKGEIPKELAALPELRAKNLEELDLEGRIPAECGSLQNLRHLDAGNNHLVGNTRDCIRFDGLFKGFKIKSLKNLILSGCIKAKDFHIISEEIVYLHLEKFICNIPFAIAHIHKLIFLNLDHNQFLGIPDAFYKLKFLKEMYIEGKSGVESLPTHKVLEVSDADFAVW